MSSGSFGKTTFMVVSFIAAVFTILGFFLGVNSSVSEYLKDNPPLLVSKKTKFSCEERKDSQEGSFIPTVIYTNNNEDSKDWIKVKNNFADDWNPNKRCGEIAKRLDSYRKQGLVALSYNPNHNNSNQIMLCAYTADKDKNCHPVLTLDVGEEGYSNSVELLDALKNGTTVYQSGEARKLSDTNKDIIYLCGYLDYEDCHGERKNHQSIINNINNRLMVMVKFFLYLTCEDCRYILS